MYVCGIHSLGLSSAVAAVDQLDIIAWSDGLCCELVGRLHLILCQHSQVYSVKVAPPPLHSEVYIFTVSHMLGHSETCTFVHSHTGVQYIFSYNELNAVVYTVYMVCELDSIFLTFMLKLQKCIGPLSWNNMLLWTNNLCCPHGACCCW